MFVSTIRRWTEQSTDPGEEFLWVVSNHHCWMLHVVLGLSALCLYQCFFCNNQYRIEANADDLETVFNARLRCIGRMVAMLDTWLKPMYNTRIWCKS